MDSEALCSAICFQQSPRQGCVAGQLRVRFDEILSGAFDVSACIDLGETGDLFACQFKHADGLLSVFRLIRRASQRSGQRTACAD
ncbi:hypothetical protein BGLA2_550020 [Burkholderia gladioli]|nr:hypothetical protein BGLA2_550020 [Burkholderia gladioli]